jgi:hypothetical protein
MKMLMQKMRATLPFAAKKILSIKVEGILRSTEFVFMELDIIYSIPLAESNPLCN